MSTMGLANTPGFFQHRMEELLGPYLWQFVLVYIDDVIIYSRTLEQHVFKQSARGKTSTRAFFTRAEHQLKHRSD